MSIGTDIIDIDEFDTTLKNGGDSFLKHHFSEAELVNRETAHLAGIYSVKEAVFKTGFKGAFEIIKDASGKPFIYDLEGNKIETISISISHNKTTVISVALWNETL